MKKKKTYVAIVLDKSGSMWSTKDQAIEGFNEQVQQMQEYAKEQDIFVSLVTFNGRVTEHLWNENVEKLVTADPSHYNPSGATAMRDAIGYTIQKLQKTATEDKDKDTAFLVIGISDGQTNSDQVYDADTLKSMIETCQNKGNWTFTFMGCDKQSMLQVAAETGVALGNMAVWDNKTANDAKTGMSALSDGTSRYFTRRSTGIASVANFTSGVEGAMADYTKEAAKGFATLKNPIGEVKPPTEKSSIFSEGKDVTDRMLEKK